jgi:hypothetical protein
VTTILADARLGVMVSDSRMNDEDRIWSVKKVFRIRGALIGAAGLHVDCEHFFDWYRDGMVEPPEFEFSESVALVLDHDGLWMFDANRITLQKLETHYEAIGTGAKGAVCAYEAPGFTDPVRAVKIACHHDAQSGPPVRSYRLNRKSA